MGRKLINDMLWLTHIGIKKPENVFFPSRESLNLIILKVIKSFRVEGAGASSRS